MTKCPNCNDYELTFIEKMTVHNYSPSTCPSCGGLYVNSTSAALKWLASTIFVVGIVVYLTESLSVINNFVVFVAALLAVPAHAWWAKPIPYSNFKLYGSRPLWKNILIFGAVPVALIAIVLTILIKYRAGM